MRNVNITSKTEGKKQILVITVDLSEQGEPSVSGKSMLIASTEGNTSFGDVKIGLNVYRPIRAAKAKAA